MWVLSTANAVRVDVNRDVNVVAAGLREVPAPAIGTHVAVRAGRAPVRRPLRMPEHGKGW
jgi:hypothetical protein